MQPWNYRHLLLSPSSLLSRNCTLRDAARDDATAELRYERRGLGGSIILWETSITYEVTYDRRKGRYTLVGKDAKETVATAGRRYTREETCVVLEMCGAKWEVVRRRGRVQKYWDVFRMRAGEGEGEGVRVGKGGSETNEIENGVVVGRHSRADEAEGEFASRGPRNRRYTVYVRREVPGEVVAFAMWIVRAPSAGVDRRSEEGCAGRAWKKLRL